MPEVQLLPSGHRFPVAGNDTVLEAALRAGYAPNYGCSSGNCGLCKAKVVAGTVEKIRFHDFVIPEAEKAMGYMLMCSNTATTDLVVEAGEALGVDDIPAQNILARIKKIERAAADTMIVHAQTPRTQRLRFLAGQYVTVTLGQAQQECYLASCPCDDRNLQFHIPLVSGQAFSEHVFQGLKPGDAAVGIAGPKGNFIFNKDSTRPVVFVGWDSGFAPIKSLIEHIMAIDEGRSLYLYWIASKNGGHYMENLCRSWSDALDNFMYTAFVAPRASQTAAELESLMARVARAQPDFADCDWYIVGPPAVAAAARVALARQGLPVTQLFVAVAGDLSDRGASGVA